MFTSAFELLIDVEIQASVKPAATDHLSLIITAGAEMPKAKDLQQPMVIKNENGENHIYPSFM